MSSSEQLPPVELEAFVLEIGGPVCRWNNASWDHGESDVWRADLESGAGVFVKRHRQPAKFAQERAAYERWAPAVGMCPRLLAARGGDLRALLLEAVPGEPLLVAQAPAEAEKDYYAQAGRWLGRLHDLPWKDEDAMDVATALAQRSVAWSERARALQGAPLSRSVIDEVHARVSAPWPAGVEVPARVPCHRDFTLRNWIVSGEAIHVIDFEHARPDWSLTDLERVKSSIPGERRELWDAFETGYGRSLEPQEEKLIERLQLHAALSRVVWAVEHEDAEFEREGREQLERLLMSSN